MSKALSDLKDKEAINIIDGRCLGRIVDAVVDLEQGQVVGLLLPGNFWSGDIFLPYRAVILIGTDVVLLNLALAEEGAAVL